MEAGLTLFSISSERVLELFAWLCLKDIRSWLLVILCGYLILSVQFRRRETEAIVIIHFVHPCQKKLHGSCTWEVQSCKTQSGQYCYGWCYWTFFPIAKHPKMTTKCHTFGWGDFWGAVGRQSSLSFTVPHFRPLSPFHSSTEVQATAQVSLKPSLPGPWRSPLCGIQSRVRAPTQAPACIEKSLECFPADFWVMPGRTGAGRAQESCPDWCR